VFTDVLQQMSDIVYGARWYLPETKIIIGVAIGLALLIYFKGTLGGLVTSILVTILVAESFFSESDLYQISLERAIAGAVLGFIAFFANLYFIVRTLADWRD
jgi:Mn2+/Fe2+ NRAMP family transporter